MSFHEPAMAAHFSFSLAQMVCLVVLLRAGLAKDIPTPEEYHFKDNAANCQNSYTLFMQPKNFRDAMNHCQQIGGVLAPKNDREVNAIDASDKLRSLDFVWMRGHCGETYIISRYSRFFFCDKKNAFICKQVLDSEDVENNVNDNVRETADQCPADGGSVQVVDSSSPNTIYSLILLKKTYEEARQHCIDNDQEMTNINSNSSKAISKVIDYFASLCPEKLVAYQTVWNNGECTGKGNTLGFDVCETAHPFVCKEPKEDKACLPDKTDGYSFKTSKHSYRLFTVKKSYAGAKDHCDSIGGQLASVVDYGLRLALADYVNCQCVGNAWESGPLWTSLRPLCNLYHFNASDGDQSTTKQELSCNAKASFVCKYSSLNQGVQYQLVKEMMTFENAIRHCGEKEGTVASFDKDKEEILSKAIEGSHVITIWDSYNSGMVISNPKTRDHDWTWLPADQLNGFLCKID